MTAKRFVTGGFVRIILPDGSYGYGRLREDMNASFYNFQTQEPISDLDEIASKPILFTVAVHKSVLARWKVIGEKSLETHLKEPVTWF